MSSNSLRKIRSHFAKTPNRIILFFVILFIILFVLHVGRQFGWESEYSRLDVFSIVERSAFDHKMRTKIHLDKSRGVSAAHNFRTAIVSINEPSVAALGRFPFSRKHYAKLVKELRRLDARVVVFDMLFSEKQVNYEFEDIKFLRQKYGKKLKATKVGQMLIEDIDQKLEYKSDDQAFAKAVEGEMKIIFGMFFSGFGRHKEDFSRPSTEGTWDTPADFNERKDIFVSKNLKGLGIAGFNVREYNDITVAKYPVLPISVLAKAAASIPEHEMPFGFFNTFQESDGLLRKLPLVAYFDGKMYPSLSLAAVAAYLKADVDGKLTLDGLEEVKGAANEGFGHLTLVPATKISKATFGKTIYGLTLPVELDGSFWINYQGGETTIPRFEMIDILNGNVAKDALKDKIVFIGATTPTLKDNKATPVGAEFPGVEVHANVAESILKLSFLTKGSLYAIVGFLFITVGAILFGVIINLLNPVVASLMTGLLVASMIYLDQHVFFEQGIIIPSMIPSIQYIGILFGITICKFVSADREKRFVETAFSRFVTGAVVQEILADQGELKMSAESKKLTVLFADIEKFTTLAERLEAEVLCSILNDLFTRFTRVILDNRGTLDKYMGDEIMCFWGAPLNEARHAELACESALRMMECVEEANKEWEARFCEKLGLRIGINTGDMIVGNMGSEQVFDYTVIGDAVNLGSRLESANRFYGSNIIVGPETYAICKDKYLFRPLDIIQVVGKKQPVEVYQLITRNDEASGADREWINTFVRARKSYLDQNWSEARASFGLCLELRPEDKASTTYLQRIDKLEHKANADWDGVWKVEAK